MTTRGAQAAILAGVLVVLGGIAAILYGIGVFGYNLDVVFPDANGATVGTQVTYQGVPIGEVKNITLVPGGAQMKLAFFRGQKDGIRAEPLFAIHKPIFGTTPTEVVLGFC